MKTDKIRSDFLGFFESKKHKIFPSDNLVPCDDSTVLFTSAGMNQFKPYFLGAKKDLKRAASAQKCLRTDDIDKVGNTSAHHTFFEMLGNFSFGDYFKKDAILWAWEFIRDVVKIPKSKIWVSVYGEDKEAWDIWVKKINFSENRIVKLGANSNFWPANALSQGPNGPCGPCSEIFYDRGPDVGCKQKNCDPGCSCGRFVEFWNLVFTQFNRTDKDGAGILKPLPMKNIDTGMGLERIAAILQGVETNFEIDIFKPIIDKVVFFADKNKKSSLSDIYAVADHVRSAVFAVAEGILPSNEERGYVVRKVIRKAVWHGNKIGIKEIFLYKLVAVVCSVMKNAYPELEKKKETIVAVISSEEEKFSNTVESGLERLNHLIKNLKKNHKKSVAGNDVFQLYDTFGFPYELTKKVAQENGLDIDQPGFQAALEEQRQRSKAASNIKGEVFSKDREMLKILKATGFIGYDRLEADSKIIAIFDPDLEKKLKKIENGKAVIVTGQTPFYGKGGGQVADRGFVVLGRSEAEVYDVKMLDERVLHFIQTKKGSFSLGDKVTLVVDKENREDIARNHTATHLLQAALRVVLGSHIEQAGSYVGSDKLRFDFNHFKALTKNEIAKVEELVNGYIMANSKLSVRITSYEQAKKDGALALFTEKYQNEVRVINIASLSSELCAGSHVSSTGEIGFFKITAETSSSGGIRRIEAITGSKALKYVQEKESALRHILDSLMVDESGAVKKIEELMESQRIASAYKVKFAQRDIDIEAEKLISQSSKIKSTAFIAVRLDRDIDYISNLLDRIKVKSKSNSVIMIYSIEDKIQLVIGITGDLIERGFDARNLIKKISGVIEGGGGGRADFVKAGGRNINGIENAVDIIKKEIEALS